MAGFGLNELLKIEYSVFEEEDLCEETDLFNSGTFFLHFVCLKGNYSIFNSVITIFTGEKR